MPDSRDDSGISAGEMSAGHSNNTSYSNSSSSDEDEEKSYEPNAQRVVIVGAAKKVVAAAAAAVARPDEAEADVDGADDQEDDDDDDDDDVEDGEKLGPPSIVDGPGPSEAYFNFPWSTNMLPTIGEVEEEFSSLELQLPQQQIR